MTQQNKNVPKLRFPEFSGEWENDKLGNYGHLINGLTYSPDNIVDVGLLVLRSSNVQHSQLSFNDNVYVNLSVPCENKTKKGDILICVRNGSKRLIGKNVIIPKDMPNTTHGAFMSVFRGSHNKFVSQWLKTSTYYREVHKNLGATINSINGSDLKKFKVIFPEVPEQQKIADFLSAVDERVDGLRRKKELLERYKKGVMQKIFSQEIRFTQPDGTAYPDWEEKSLNEVLELVVDNRGKTPPISNDGIPLIEVNAIGQKSINYNKVTKFVDKSTYDSWFRKYLKKGDVLFSTVGATATCSYYEGCNTSAIAQNIVGLRFFYGNSNFMFYLLTEPKNNYEFKKIEMQAVQPSVKVSQMIKLKFKLPHPDEQKVVADFLTSVDKKVEATDLQLEQAKKFKKALLQQMFV